MCPNTGPISSGTGAPFGLIAASADGSNAGIDSMPSEVFKKRRRFGEAGSFINRGRFPTTVEKVS
ncbi:hypothetical protein llg_36700 [Luteolibacter sp. LG18]|nr:hypothetical protein llg_36700 [Luteolibacter sp. LG18]